MDSIDELFAIFRKRPDEFMEHVMLRIEKDIEKFYQYIEKIVIMADKVISSTADLDLD